VQPAPPTQPTQRTQPATPPAPPAAQTPPSPQTQPPPAAREESRDQQPTVRRLEDFRDRRRETREGNRITIREPDRVIIREGDRTIIRHDEGDRFRRRARDVRTERRGDETRTIAMRPNGTAIITVTDESGRLLRRIRRGNDGREVVIIDNARGPRRSGFDVFINVPPPVVRIPRERYIVESRRADRELIYETLIAPPVMQIERPYSLDEIRYNQNLRERMRRVDIDTITFDTGSWEVRPDQAASLEIIAGAIRQAIRRNPNEVFLIEGHTDAVGADIDNLSLSDRRAESVAVALTEAFEVLPENLTTQGYGEQFLKVPTDGPEEQNRRVTVRRITPLLAGK
jgi:outer membrane protein OmpA-like peptidoglycan-associated protein